MSAETTERPQVLYHGTQAAIHYSDKPFLIPRYGSYRRDERDPKEPFVMATPNPVTAAIFALKTHEVRTIFHDIPEPAIIFSGFYLHTQLRGWSYEISTEGFQEVIRHGKPTNKWYILKEDMPEVLPGVRGVPLENPKRVDMQTLITKHDLRIYQNDTYRISNAEYTQRVQDAINSGTEEDFIATAEEEGWLSDMTNVVQEVYDRRHTRVS